jgi:hypothetical protein
MSSKPVIESACRTRFSVYIIEELVPDAQRCSDNERALQELLYEAAAGCVPLPSTRKARAAPR